MLKSAAGLILIPNEPDLKIMPFKDVGCYWKFKAVSQEASNGVTAKLHHYMISMFVPHADTNKWKVRIVPGQMFLISNAGVSAVISEGYSYPMVEIRVEPKNLSYLKKPLTVGDNENVR